MDNIDITVCPISQSAEQWKYCNGEHNRARNLWEKKTTDQYTNHNYQWCEINVSLVLTSDVLNSAL